MRLNTIGLLLGSSSLLLFTELPHWLWLAIPFLVIVPLSYKYPNLQFIAAVLIGLIWATLVAQWKIADRLPVTLEGVDILVEGKITGLPSRDTKRTKFDLIVYHSRLAETTTNPANYSLLAQNSHLRLNWYQWPPEIHSGDTWQLKVRLKRPNGFMNPGGFDYEAWLFRQNIDAVGYVRAGKKQPMETNQRIKESPAWHLDSIRQAVRQSIVGSIPDSPVLGLINALIIGDRSLITPEQWQVMDETGTNHLMAISGLHVGLIAGFAYFLMNWLWRRSARLMNLIPAQKAGAWAAIFVALLYAAMAGFSIPTQRALLMVVVAMIGLITQRNILPSHLIAVAMLGVLAIDPLAPMDTGFWLSFFAVAILIYGMAGRLGVHNWWWKWGRAQWLIFIGLMPLIIFYFGRLPLSAPLANIVAIPWVSFTTVPLSLLGGLLASVSLTLSEPVLYVASKSLEGLWHFLGFIPTYIPTYSLSHSTSIWALLGASVGGLLLLAPRGVPARWIGVLFFLPLFYSPSTPITDGQAELTLLDVGQGLAVVVQTKRHTFVYDTGPSFSDTFDTGNAVVLPFLRSKGINKVDALVLSHDDNDHVGGAISILSQIKVDRLLTSWSTNYAGHPSQLCQKLDHWRWDGVLFEVLHPSIGDYPGKRRDNNRSCVIKVSTGQSTVLLTGDIEKTVERHLLKAAKKGDLAFKSDIMLVPHHGSLTSSTQTFIDAVNPSVALVSAGYRNRWAFPKTKVLERYLQRGIEILTTSHYGAITFKLDPMSPPIRSNAFRVDQRRYWYSH